MITDRVSRRALLQGGLAAAGVLAIGFEAPLGVRRARAQGAGVFAPNQWIRIDRDGVVTIVNSVPEMGQGSLTTMPPPSSLKKFRRSSSKSCRRREMLSCWTSSGLTGGRMFAFPFQLGGSFDRFQDA